MRELVLDVGIRKAEKPKSSIKKKIVRSILALAALGGTAYGVNEAYQNDLLPIRPVHSTFNNTENKGAIGNKNIIQIDKNTLVTIDTLPAIQTPKNDVYLLMPFQSLPPDANIPYDKDFTGKYVNPSIMSGLEKLQYAKEQGTKDKIIFRNIPKDTVILAPIDGLLEFYARPKVAPTGTIEGVNIFYKSPEGTIYQVHMGPPPGKLLKPLVDAKPYVFGQTENTERSRSALRVEVKRGQPIALTPQSADFSLSTQAWPSGKIGVEGTGIYPTNINFITLPDSFGQSKVAILGK